MSSYNVEQSRIDQLVNQSLSASTQEVEAVLHKQHFSLADFTYLISPAAQPHLEYMAKRAHDLTVQRFGYTMQLFIPLYLSNECYNNCSYCGFSMRFDYPRITLTEKDILKEGIALKEKGFHHLLLLTGEAPKTVGVDYIEKAVRLLAPHFSSIGIEVQPLEQADYRRLIDAGADSLALYQESYHLPSYKKHHISGKKRLFQNRLDAVDKAAKAGMYRIHIGVLLGLYDWRYEAMAMLYHLSYLQRHYWQTKYGLSFPRINSMLGDFKATHPVSDIDLVQLICACRLVFPDISLTLSTREAPDLRDHLIPLGITQMSAESDTAPGAYASQKEAEKQFDISDFRSLEQIKAQLRHKGYDPVLKDWQSLVVS